MNNKKMNKLDFIFIIGIIIIAITAVVIDGIYWRDVKEGGFPVFSCLSIYVSYALLIILLIGSFSKNNEDKPEYVRWYMFFLLPFFHIVIIIILLIVLALFMNIFEVINK